MKSVSYQICLHLAQSDASEIEVEEWAESSYLSSVRAKSGGELAVTVLMSQYNALTVVQHDYFILGVDLKMLNLSRSISW